MNTVHAVLFGILTALIATTAYAQKPSAGPEERTPRLGGQSVTAGPRLGATPLFVIADLAVGIWARVPPPYDVAANRNAAANPLP
jgi:hypothetical protein